MAREPEWLVRLYLLCVCVCRSYRCSRCVYEGCVCIECVFMERLFLRHVCMKGVCVLMEGVITCV